MIRAQNARRAVMLGGFVALALSSTLVAPVGSVMAQEAKSTLTTVRERGKLIAGVRYDFPPYGSIDRQGKPVGYGVDVARAMAEKLGVQVEFVQTTSQNRIPLLQSGKIDAEFGITSMTAARDEVVDFSIPYMWDSLAILTHKGMPTTPQGYAPPRVLGTPQGSVNVEMFRKVVPTANIRLYQEYSDLVVALVAKRLDGVIITESSAVEHIRRHPELIVTANFNYDAIGIMMRENDSKWRDYINFTLQELWADGKLQKVIESHFGAPPKWQLWSVYGLQPGVEAGQRRFGDRK